jgi:hypothetical protein
VKGEKQMDGIEDFLQAIAQLLAAIGLFVCIPMAIYKGLKNRTDLKKKEQERRIFELEVEKQNNQLKLIEEENKKWDRIIEEKTSQTAGTL